MAIRVYKPTSPARRFMSVLTYDEITKTTPEKSLTEYLKKHSGRNNQGKITVRHQGGGNKIKYRIIDFKRNKKDIPATVAAIEYDPNRSANIALLHYADGEKRYILAPLDLKVGMTVVAADAPQQHPGRHTDPQPRGQARSRRPAGPLRWSVSSADGQRERIRYSPSSFR